MRRFLFFIPVILFFCGCDDPASEVPVEKAVPPAEKTAEPQERTRIFQIGTVSFGKSPVSYYREIRIQQERFITSDDLLELYCTPITNQVWRIDLVVPVMPGHEDSDPVAELKKFIGKKFDLDFATAYAVDLPDTRIELSRAFDRGPRGVRCTFIDRQLETLFRSENSSPEAVSKRLIMRAGEDVLRLEAALRDFKQDTGVYPAQLSDLVKKGDITKWQGPYIESIPEDPWGKAYYYRLSDKGFELYSTGFDGTDKIR